VHGGDDVAEDDLDGQRQKEEGCSQERSLNALPGKVSFGI
jgi:hypothetical protein